MEGMGYLSNFVFNIQSYSVKKNEKQNFSCHATCDVEVKLKNSSQYLPLIQRQDNTQNPTIFV